MYSEELIKKVFDYDGRMRWLRGKEYSNRQENMFYKLKYHYLVDNQGTKIKAVITKIESVVGKIAKLISDVKKEEDVKEYAQSLKSRDPGYEEKHYLERAEDVFNTFLHGRSREIIYTVLALSIIDLAGILEDAISLGDEVIDKELEEITQDIRVLLDIYVPCYKVTIAFRIYEEYETSACLEERIDGPFLRNKEAKLMNNRFFLTKEPDTNRR